MKKVQLLLCLLLSVLKLSAQNNSFQFVNTDIPNFWKAYDLIQSTKDTNLHSTILQREYIDKGSDGLKSLMRVRNYTKSSFLQAMRQYPRFWNSIRKSSLSVNSKIPGIEKSLNSLRIIYPEAKPATVYFCMGAFRTNGTIEDNKILIGAEMALTDDNTDISELPENLQTYYKKYKPAETIDLLVTHEYIHTQQQLPLDNLLCNSLYEGVAEYLSCLATGKTSTTPSFGFASANQEKVKAKYVEDLFLPDRMYNWLWGTNNNELKERDLGYYIGYRIAEEYYRKSSNNKTAIHNLIRGLSPYPGAWTELQGKTCKLFTSHPNDKNLPGKAPGDWESDFKTYLNFQCGEGHLTILDLQLEGKKRMKVDELLRGWKG
jgi:hypothetical protein